MWERGRLDREEGKYFDDLGTWGYNDARCHGNIRHERWGISAAASITRGDREDRSV